jgi:uncharacterized protein (TIGR02444 family)
MTAASRRVPNSFWRWSLRIYRLPGVESALLALQDGAGTDTNLLLWCCWQAGEGRALDRRTLRRSMAATARWQSEVIVPLRRARRALGRAPQGLPDGWAGELRKRIGAVELDMEYAEQRALFELALSLPPLVRTLAPRDAALASIARYLGLLGAEVAPAVQRLVEVVIDACWPAPNAALRTARRRPS